MLLIDLYSQNDLGNIVILVMGWLDIFRAERRSWSIFTNDEMLLLLKSIRP